MFEFAVLLGLLGLLAGADVLVVLVVVLMAALMV